ncbi:hypothetical protein N0V88_005579 [Collariella sp. IMI 366227]|nr:hypothetical protein N0V88_005579 [Collariella sp. IMI 366227]
MARSARPLMHWSDEDDDDEFPDIMTLVSRKKQQPSGVPSTNSQPGHHKTPIVRETTKPPPSARRRKLAPLTDNLLLRAWTPDNTVDGDESHSDKENFKLPRPRVQRRTTTRKPPVIIPSSPGEDEYVSAREEATIIEEVSIVDDTFHTCDSEGSGLNDSNSIFGVSEDDEDFITDTPPRKTPAKPRVQVKGAQHAGPGSENGQKNNSKPAKKHSSKNKAKGDKGLTDALPSAPATTPIPTPPTTHHHASIELAEKVISDSHRLLNVLAHEFCHLANFMVSNITTNPHGKEFKAWAAKVSAAFGDRGVQVTTKHSYEIDFKGN